MNFMTTIKEEVDEVFRRLATGKLSTPTTTVSSGWEMHLPTGRIVVRSILQEEARPIIALSLDAVPHLLPMVMSDELALRYVAIYALEQITGKKPYFPYFGKANVESHRAKAIEIWRKWYEINSK